MSIRARIHKAARSQYAAIPNSIAQSRTLSPAARAVLIELLSRPDDWETRPAQLAYEYLSVRKVYRVLNELIDAGYVTRTAVRGDEGKIAYWRYDVFNEPLAKTDEVAVVTNGADPERKRRAMRARTHYVANGTHTKKEEEERETNAPPAELPDYLTPSQRRMIAFPNRATERAGDGGATAYALLNAYCDAWNVTAERYRQQWRRIHAEAAEQLAALGATPDEVGAMVAERRAKDKQPDESPLVFLARDYVGWKMRQAQPAALAVSETPEQRRAREAQDELERAEWRRAQGVLS